MKKLFSVIMTGAVLATCVSARASSFFDRYEPPTLPYDLKTGYPLQLQDAYAVPTGEIRLQSSFFFDRRVGNAESRGDVFSMKPEVQWGVAPFGHLRAQIPVYTGSGPTSTSGDIILGGFYNFLDETNGRPAMGISADLEIPTGTHSRGLDPIFFYYVTKTIGSGNCAKVHANIGWIHNSGNFEGERENMYVLRFGYSQEFLANTVFGIDFVREKLRQQYITENVIEIGALHSLTRLLNLSVTLGAGMGDTSPVYRIGGGVQLKWH
jgi:hypothetical protein